EAKMLHHYDHRWATYEPDGSIRDFTLAEKSDPDFVIIPRDWVPEQDVPTHKQDKSGNLIVLPGVSTRLAAKGWRYDWLLGWRDICRATDERTAISFVLPKAGAGNKVPLMLSTRPARELLLLQSCLSSYVFDFCSRQKIGGTTMNFFIWEQLPILSPEMMGALPWDGNSMATEWMACRALELNST